MARRKKSSSELPGFTSPATDATPFGSERAGRQDLRAEPTRSRQQKRAARRIPRELKRRRRSEALRSGLGRTGRIVAAIAVSFGLSGGIMAIKSMFDDPPERIEIDLDQFDFTNPGLTVPSTIDLLPTRPTTTPPSTTGP